MRGAIGPPAVAVGPPDTLRAARLFLEKSVGRVPGLAACRGRGGALGYLPGHGGTARGSARVRGCGLAIAEARDQL